MASPADDHVHVYLVDGTVIDPTTGGRITSAKCTGCPAVKTNHEPAGPDAAPTD